MVKTAFKDPLRVKMNAKRLKPSLSSEVEVRHAWVGACEAGDTAMVSLLMPVVEQGEGGVNCTDSLGMTGLMAALETAQLDVVELLLDHKNIDREFTMKDIWGRTALDLAVRSKSAYFIPTILDALEDKLEQEELQELLLLRILQCVLEDKIEHFSKMLDYFDINFSEGSLLWHLILLQKTELILVIINEFGLDLVIADMHRTSFLMALRSGYTGMVRPLFQHFKQQIKSIIRDPKVLGTGSTKIITEVKREIFTLMFQDLDTGAEENFTAGLDCIDVNQQDADGNTLLIQAVKVNCLFAVKAIMQVDGLDVNHMNKAGRSALDFINIPCLVKEDEINPYFYPVMNSVTMKPLSTVASKTFSIDMRVMFLFHARQQQHKDTDFNFSKMPLLVRALKSDKLDLASFLLVNCNYKVTAGEMEVARRMLASGTGHIDIRRGLQDMLVKLGTQE